MAKTCPRCGNVAAADGHALYGETQECREAFAFEQQLARWAAQWIAATVSITAGDETNS